jgi:Zn-dependent protease
MTDYLPELERLSVLARSAEHRGDYIEELRLWRQALDLAPRDSDEYPIINNRVQELSRRIDEGETQAKPKTGWMKKFGPLAPVLYLLWKMKTIVLLILSKGKLLLLGLGKFSTFSSMLVSMGAYWAIYGWKFAAGIVISIYVHEMGHVWALRRFGISASAPMFIPFLGAFVRMNQRPANPVEDARVGLAGPIWGTAFAIAAFVAYGVTAEPAIGAIAHFAAWINMFNLLPVWQLDGARGFAALSKTQRAGIAAVMAAAGYATGEGFLYILAVCGAIRIFMAGAPEKGDAKTMIQFCGLLIVLGLLMAVPIARPNSTPI